MEALVKQKKLDKELIRYTVATGCGRNVLRDADQDITEIACHAKGASYLFARAHTVIDMGGQDSKVVQIGDDGNVVDFIMNDTCAAGTGRFLEMMAEKLGVSPGEFSTLGRDWKEEVVISSMCAVFAESEVVSLIAGGGELPDIIHGINNSVANRVVGMLARARCAGAYVMTGGVARNTGVVRALSERLEEEVLVPQEPQLVGALGAALFAHEAAYGKP
jgi:predicted CoA-substrate-specific enzyme activase